MALSQVTQAPDRFDQRTVAGGFFHLFLGYIDCVSLACRSLSSRGRCFDTAGYDYE